MASDFKAIQVGKGLAHWPCIDKEASFQGKPNGKKECGIILEGAALTAAREAVQAFIDDTFPAKKAKAVQSPFKQTADGKVLLKFTTNHLDKTGKEKLVPVFNAKGQRVNRAVAVGNGSIIRIDGAMAPTEFKGTDHVKMFLNSIQVIKLVEPQSGGGFAPDEEEGSWTGDEFDGTPGDHSGDPGPSGTSGADF